MMKRNFLLNLVLLLMFTICSSLALAAEDDTGPASIYRVTITKLEMYNGTSWITVSSGSSTTMDIASVNAGEAAGNFFSGLNVPDGSYTQMKVTPSGTFTISGHVGALYTTAGTVEDGEFTACVSSGNAADVAECNVQVSLEDPAVDVLPSTLVIKDGIASHKIRINFDVNTMIQEGPSQTLFPAEPNITITMIALQ